MRRCLLPLILLLFTSSLSSAASDFEVIRKNIFDALQFPRETSELNAEALIYKSTMLPDGSWADIDYADKSWTSWSPGIHLNRLFIMAMAYSRLGNIGINADLTLYNAIEDGLTFYYERNPVSDNWWHNEINAGQALGFTMVLMRFGQQQLPAALEESLFTRMKGNPYSWTAANKFDIAIHWLCRAVLREDPILLEQSVEQIYQPVKIAEAPVLFSNDPNEGIQADQSFLMHGTQPMTFSYGVPFLGIYIGAAFLQNTSYEMLQAQADILSDFFYTTFIAGVRGSVIDFSQDGRGVSRTAGYPRTNPPPYSLEGSGYYRSYPIIDLVINMEPDPVKKQAFLDAKERWELRKPASYGVKPKNNYFFRADMAQHIRPGYYFSVRSNSSRVMRTESLNGENLKGNFLSEGATNIRRHGAEYLDIMPVWEWDKIPGTTTLDFDSDPLLIDANEGTGSTIFVGGVSDGRYGAGVFKMNVLDPKYSVKGQKSWFFFDDEVVCLGSMISSSNPQPVVTTINQCNLNSAVTIMPKTGVLSVLPAETGTTLVDPRWVLHDSIGYFFPLGGNITVSNATQSGTKKSINQSYSDELITAPVFKAFFNHGSTPFEGTYAYVVVPGKGSTEQMNAYDTDKIRILRNDADIQAVKHEGLDMLQVVFYKAGKLTDPVSKRTIEVNNRCVLLVKNLSTGEMKFSISDPTQKLGQVVIKVRNEQGALLGNAYKVSLPRGVYGGSTVNFEYPLFGHCAVTASGSDSNLPGNVADNNLNTRWSSYGNGQWVQLCLDQPQTIEGLYIAFFLGNQRRSTFDVKVSADGTRFRTVILGGRSSGTTVEKEFFPIQAANVKYIRIVGRGNNKDLWNSYTEAGIYVPDGIINPGKEKGPFTDNITFPSAEKIAPPGDLITPAELIFFPNPTSSFLQSSAGGIWKIYDAMGRTIKTIVAEPFERVFLADFPSGLYVVQLSDASGRLLKVQKVLKY